MRDIYVHVTIYGSKDSHYLIRPAWDEIVRSSDLMLSLRSDLDRQKNSLKSLRGGDIRKGCQVLRQPTSINEPSFTQVHVVLKLFSTTSLLILSEIGLDRGYSQRSCALWFSMPQLRSEQYENDGVGHHGPRIFFCRTAQVILVYIKALHFLYGLFYVIFIIPIVHIKGIIDYLYTINTI